MVDNPNDDCGDEATTRDVAHVYPWASWDQPTEVCLKALLLFFDGVSALLPKYEWKRTRMETELTGLMVEQGLLTLLDPAVTVSQEVAVPLADEVMRLVDTGLFDGSRKALRNNTTFVDPEGVPVLREKFGAAGDADLAQFMIDLLTEAGLAGVDEDVGTFVKMPEYVADTILVLLGQLVPTAITTTGERHHPVSDRERLGRLIRADPSTTIAPLALADLVSIDARIEDVPLAAILEFRLEHRDDLRRYMDDLAAFVRNATATDARDREDLLRSRSEDLRAELHEFTARRGRQRTRLYGTIGLGLLTAAWAGHSDPVAGALALGTMATGLPDRSQALGPHEFVIRYADRADGIP